MSGRQRSSTPGRGGGTRPVALTIAGSDSGGGAGIQADLKTFEAFGVFGTSAITAVTAQNTLGVQAVAVMTPDMVEAQIRAVREDLAPAAMKTGMLAERGIVEAVASALRTADPRPLVVDPVMVATSGDPLLASDAIAALRTSLLPLAALVTPNLPEAGLLIGRDVRTVDDMRDAARQLVDAGASAALLKGGHLRGERIVDVLWDGTSETIWRTARLDRTDTHGTGCTLSAAVTAGLALGESLSDAVGAALDYTRAAIESAPGLGAGRGPLEHRGVSGRDEPSR